MFQARCQENDGTGWIDSGIMGGLTCETAAEAILWSKENLGDPVDGLRFFRWAVVNLDTGEAVCTV